MMRRSRKTKLVRKVARTVCKAAKPATVKRDPLDDFIAAGARALDLKIDKTWVPAVRGHLQVTLRPGPLVACFKLPDEAEPAPVFKAGAARWIGPALRRSHEPLPTVSAARWPS